VQPDPQLAPRILLCALDVGLRRNLDTRLRHSGFSVRTTNEPAAIEVLLRSYEPDIVIVDGDLRDGDAAVSEQIRADDDVFMIVITRVGAPKAQPLRDGADDVIDDETDIEEVAARCETLLRRPRRLRTRWDPKEASTVRFGPLVIDLGRREVTMRGESVALTRLEFDLLTQLCRRPREVSTRADLLEQVWGPGWVGDSHVVDVHLSNLRRKLTLRADDVRCIHTVRGVGFRLSDELLDLAHSDLDESNTAQA
jgi:DNA-binding response OmpR family regulator